MDSEVQEQLTRLECERLVAKRRAQELEQQNQQLQDTVAQLRGELQAATSADTEHDAQLLQLQQAKERLDADFAYVSREFKANEIVVISLKENNRVLSSQLLTLQKEYQKQSAQLQTVQQLSDKTASTRDKLDAQLRSTTQERNDLQQALAVQTAQFEHTKGELEQCYKQFELQQSDMAAGVRSLMAEKAELAAKCAALVAQLKDTQSGQSAAEVRERDLKQEVNSIRDFMNVNTGNMEAMGVVGIPPHDDDVWPILGPLGGVQSVLDIMLKHMQKCDKKLKAKAEENDALADKLKLSVQQISDLKEQMFEARALYAKAVRDREAVQLRMDSLEQDKQTFEHSVQRSKQQALEDAQRMKKLQEDVLSLNRQVQSLLPYEAECKAHTTERESLVLRLKRLQETHDVTRQKLDDALTEASHHRMERDVLKADLSTLQDKIQGFKRKMTDLRLERDTSLNQHTALHQQHTELQLQHARLQQQLGKLRLELLTKTEELERRSAAGMDTDGSSGALLPASSDPLSSQPASARLPSSQGPDDGTRSRAQGAGQSGAQAELSLPGSASDLHNSRPPSGRRRSRITGDPSSESAASQSAGATTASSRRTTRPGSASQRSSGQADGSATADPQEGVRGSTSRADVSKVPPLALQRVGSSATSLEGSAAPTGRGISPEDSEDGPPAPPPFSPRLPDDIISLMQARGHDYEAARRHSQWPRTKYSLLMWFLQNLKHQLLQATERSGDLEVQLLRLKLQLLQNLLQREQAFAGTLKELSAQTADVGGVASEARQLQAEVVECTRDARELLQRIQAQAEVDVARATAIAARQEKAIQSDEPMHQRWLDFVRQLPAEPPRHDLKDKVVPDAIVRVYLRGLQALEASAAVNIPGGLPFTVFDALNQHYATSGQSEDESFAQASDGPLARLLRSCRARLASTASSGSGDAAAASAPAAATAKLRAFCSFTGATPDGSWWSQPSWEFFLRALQCLRLLMRDGWSRTVKQWGSPAGVRLPMQCIVDWVGNLYNAQDQGALGDVEARMAPLVVTDGAGPGADLDALLIMLVEENMAGRCPREPYLHPRRLTDGQMSNVLNADGAVYLRTNSTMPKRTSAGGTGLTPPHSRGMDTADDEPATPMRRAVATRLPPVDEGSALNLPSVSSLPRINSIPRTGSNASVGDAHSSGPSTTSSGALPLSPSPLHLNRMMTMSRATAVRKVATNGAGADELAAELSQEWQQQTGQDTHKRQLLPSRSIKGIAAPAVAT